MFQKLPKHMNINMKWPHLYQHTECLFCSHSVGFWRSSLLVHYHILLINWRKVETMNRQFRHRRQLVHFDTVTLRKLLYVRSIVDLMYPYVVHNHYPFLLCRATNRNFNLRLIWARVQSVEIYVSLWDQIHKHCLVWSSPYESLKLQLKGPRIMSTSLIPEYTFYKYTVFTNISQLVTRPWGNFLVTLVSIENSSHQIWNSPPASITFTDSSIDCFILQYDTQDEAVVGAPVLKWFFSWVCDDHAVIIIRFKTLRSRDHHTTTATYGNHLIMIVSEGSEAWRKQGI